MGFLSLWRLLAYEAHSTWACRTQYVPLSGFITSQRLPSSHAYQPCFMLDPPMGFALQSFSPPEQLEYLIGILCLPDIAVSQVAPKSGLLGPLEQKASYANKFS